MSIQYYWMGVRTGFHLLRRDGEEKEIEGEEGMEMTGRLLSSVI
jgi:hypothetical protein